MNYFHQYKRCHSLSSLKTLPRPSFPKGLLVKLLEKAVHTTFLFSRIHFSTHFNLVLLWPFSLQVLKLVFSSVSISTLTWLQLPVAVLETLSPLSVSVNPFFTSPPDTTHTFRQSFLLPLPASWRLSKVSLGVCFSHSTLWSYGISSNVMLWYIILCICFRLPN